MTFLDSFLPTAIPSLDGITTELQNTYSTNNKWKEYIKITVSSMNMANYRDPYNLFNITNSGDAKEDNWCSHDNDKKPYFIVSFTKFSLIASYYSIKLKTIDETFPLEWNVSGSVDNTTWELLNSDTLLNQSLHTGMELIFPFQNMKPYKNYKFEQISNSISTSHFCLRRIEFFGQIYKYPVITLHNHNMFTPTPFLFIIFLSMNHSK